jgi:hypothetical protein
MYKTEFPDFKLDVSIPAGFVDNSWHNNAMPCWIRELPDEKMMVLWIDYADPALRDHPQNARFVLHVTDSSMTDVYENFASDSYADVLNCLGDYFPHIHLSDDELREAISELWKRVPNDDHARNFQEWDAVSNIDAEISARSMTSEAF